jgi:hypothetical protein
MGFKQLPDERFERSGIAAPFAYMFKPIEELEALLNIEFVHTFDELDYCDVALLETDEGLLFGLLHHKRAPVKNVVTILGNERSANPRQELEQFMNAIGMDYSEVIPCHEKIRDSLEEDILSGVIPPSELSSHLDVIFDNLYELRNDEFVQDVIFQTSLKAPARLHSYLSKIFFHRINMSTVERSLPWRDFKGDVEYLVRAVKSKDTNEEKREWALENLMETRVPENMQFALEHSKKPEELLGRVGYKLIDGNFVKLYSSEGFHIAFPKDYLSSDHHQWFENMQPATGWHQYSFGGKLDCLCDQCKNPLSKMIDLNPVPKELGIRATRLNLVTCLSCGVQSILFHKHDEFGHIIRTSLPIPLDEKIDEHPHLKEAKINLSPLEPRFRVQDWWTGNDNENLFRVGGFPTWIQDPAWERCPDCNDQMRFILQLNSGLPTNDKDILIFWGSGGLCYVYWCDDCRVSCFSFQCT